MQTPALLIRQMNIHDSGNLYQPDFPEGGSFSSLPLSLFLSPSLLPSSLVDFILKADGIASGQTQT